MLAHKDCAPCLKDALPLAESTARSLLKDVPGWALAHGSTAIFRKYTFPDFNQAFEFSEKVARLAQLQDHHPDIAFGWGYVKLRLMTHAIKGLHENDFIMAAKINEL